MSDSPARSDPAGQSNHANPDPAAPAKPELSDPPQPGKLDPPPTGKLDPPPPPKPSRVLCLGEALVDLICQHPISRLSEAGAFVPHFGGAVANVAVVAARAGAHVALAGGAGDDDWGSWLRQKLVNEAVDVSEFVLLQGRQTPLAVVAIDHDGEARYQIHGETIGTVVQALDGRLEAALEQSAALFLSSNTLIGDGERAVSMRARELALAADMPVIFDPNLRLHRWSSHAEAAASANAFVPGALLVRTNREEAALMTGEDDPERAAMAFRKAGARLVVITLGAEGAILRGELRANAPGAAVQVVSTVGAGDVLTGILLARLAMSGFYPSSVAASLAEAVKASARACERWGAVD